MEDILCEAVAQDIKMSHHAPRNISTFNNYERKMQDKGPTVDLHGPHALHQPHEGRQAQEDRKLVRARLPPGEHEEEREVADEGQEAEHLSPSEASQPPQQPRTDHRGQTPGRHHVAHHADTQGAADERLQDVTTNVPGLQVP